MTTEDQPPTRAKVARKRKERGIHDVQFKTLVIKPMRQQLRKEGQGEGPRQALHFVRAHFKEYTADAPPFGKHVGRYFWQMHAAGASDQGKVVKGYNVKPKSLSGNPQGPVPHRAPARSETGRSGFSDK